VSAVSGGLVVSTPIGLLTANYRSGGRTRVSTIASGLTLLAGTLLFPSLIFSLPLVVLAAILVVASLRVFDRWTLSIAREALFAKVRADRGRARINLLIVAAVLAATVLGQPVIGAAAGVALSCLVFIAQMSRPVIGRRWSGDVVHSKRVRSRHHGEVLRHRGGRIKILDLQGVLFFGNSDDLASDMRALEADAETIILDLHRVADIDTSGATALQQVAARFRVESLRHLDAGAMIKRIGVEPRQLRLLEFRHVKNRAPEAEYPDASDVLSGLRLRKDKAEVDKMRRAVKIAQDALEATIPFIKVGMTEKEISSELVVQLLKHGSDSEMPFSPIVSAGPNSANPHASPTERKLQAGDLLVVDWGAAHDGYISDLTRTFAIGHVDEEYSKIHKIVQEANAAGRAAGGPGVPCANVDKATRDVIENAGYGVYFTHRTGHGIGMEGHEEPYMRSDNMQLLEPGMAYTVEPGIYLPGRNGVRIEDNVVVTDSGVDVLSDMPREIRVVG
jgi:Xaa-Pro dipeptidase